MQIAWTALVRINVRANTDIWETVQYVSMSMNVYLATTPVTLTLPARILLDHFNVNVSKDLLAMVCNVLTSMSANEVLSIAMHTPGVETLPGHFSVNAMEGLLETEKPVKTSTNALTSRFVLHTLAAQTLLAHTSVYATLAIQDLASSVKVCTIAHSYVTTVSHIHCRDVSQDPCLLWEGNLCSSRQ